MGTQAPGSDQRRDNPNNQGTSSPGSKDPARKDQMEQSGHQNQPGGSQKRPDDKEKDRNKSGAQRPD